MYFNRGVNRSGLLTYADYLEARNQIWALSGADAAHGTRLQRLRAFDFGFRQIYRESCINGAAVHDLVSYGGGQFLGRIGNWFAMQGDNFVVGRTLGADALGLYGRSYAMMSLPAQLFGQVANEVLFPAMASVQHDREKLRVAFRHSSAVLALLALPASIVVALLGDETVRVLLGPSWVLL